MINRQKLSYKIWEEKVPISKNLYDLLKKKDLEKSKFISNGDALVGISYLSDAISSPNILIVAKIDEKIFSYKKPTYWAAKIKRNEADNDYDFIKWLRSIEAQRIIKNYGFESIN